MGNKDVYRCVSVRCNSWVCPDCSAKKGKFFRRRLHDRIHLFGNARLFTFTVNPGLFESAYDAYEFVRCGKFIPRLMRYLGIVNWVCVMECHKSSYPHWHLLIDVSNLCGAWIRGDDVSYSRPVDVAGWRYVPHFVDLRRVHRLWREWGIGEQVDLSRVRSKNPRHCVNYITKYLTKYPAGGYPDWLLGLSRVRFVSSSRSVGALVSDGVNQDRESVSCENEIDVKNDDCKVVRSMGYRVCRCGLSTIVLRCVAGGGYEYAGFYDMPLRFLVRVRPEWFFELDFYHDDGLSCVRGICVSELGLRCLDELQSSPDLQGFKRDYVKKRQSMIYGECA
jgi:hypothetical protein